MWPRHTCAPLRAASPQSCVPSELYPLRAVSPPPLSLLTPGDWTTRVWTDDTAVKTPILTTKYHSTYLTGGTWSPTRPGVFFTTKMDGTLDVWDLFYKHNEPTLTVQVWNECAGMNVWGMHPVRACGTFFYKHNELTLTLQDELGSPQL